MLKAAIEKIQEMSKPIFQVVEGRHFYITEGSMQEVRPTIDQPATRNLCSLDALVKLVKTEAFKLYPKPLYITIPNHVTVECFSQPVTDARYQRLTYYVARATDVPGWEANTQLSFEEAMIALRTRFQDTVDTKYALKLLSEITTGAKITFNDNGIATTVVTKKGVDLQSNETIRPIVSLKPYRTFQEIEQPASEFLLRVNERGITFVEADGGMWKLEARKTIQSYFEEAFFAEIKAGDVVVAI